MSEFPRQSDSWKTRLIVYFRIVGMIQTNFRKRHPKPAFEVTKLRNTDQQKRILSLTKYSDGEHHFIRFEYPKLHSLQFSTKLR